MGNIFGASGLQKAHKGMFVALVVLVLAGVLCSGCAKASDSTQSAAGSQSTSGSQSASSDQSASVGSPQVPSDAISWQEASKYVGQVVTIYGQVVNVTIDTEDSKNPTYFDMGAAYPDTNRFTMIVYGEDKLEFPESPDTMYGGKTIAVSGEVYEHDNVCYIKATSPSQVEVLD